MTRVPQVVVYDPNHVNGYGRELAHLLSRDQTVQLYLPRDPSWVPAGPRLRPVLAVDRANDGLLRTTLLRLVGPFRATWAARRRSVLIAVWVRDPWDGVCLILAATLGVRVVVVNHNPTAIRSRPGLAGWVERRLKRRATNVVHSALMLDAARKDASDVRVAPHPPYAAWTALYSPSRRRQPGGSTVLALGALRTDKAIDDVVAAVTHTRHRPLRLIVAGRGDLPPRARATLAASGVELDDRSSISHLSEEAIAAAVSDSDVLLAPYEAVTQSGAVVLAVSAGLPVLGYRRGALPELVAPSALTEPHDLDAYASLIDRFLDDPWPTAATTADELAAQCAAAWSTVIGDLEDM